MKIVSSYGIEIKQLNKALLPTVAIYNNAITFCVDVFENEWSNIESLDAIKRKEYCEKLIKKIITKIIENDLIKNL